MFNLCAYEIRLHFYTIAFTFSLFFLYLFCIPLFLGFWQDLLYQFHLGILWTCIVFSFLSDTSLITDLQDGTLEFYFLSKFPLQLILLCKLIGNWLLKISGILCCYPVLSLFYSFAPSAITCFSLILGTLLFSFICGVHSLLTLGAQGTNDYGSLQYLTTLPTLLPLILLCTYVQAEKYHLLFLIGYLLLFFFIYSIVTLVTLRHLLSQ
jgi:heme exporter protein CcmB